MTDALRTYLYTADGLELSFTTPYVLKGLFKKTIQLEETFISDVKEHIFD